MDSRQLYFQSSLWYCANVSIASQRSQPIPKLHQTHPFIPWVIWQQFSSKQVLSSSFPSIILPPVVFMYPAFILFHLLSFTPVSSCSRGGNDSFSNFSPHFPAKGSCHRWQFYSQLLRENSTHQQPPCPCQGLPRVQHLTHHRCLLIWINVIGSSPFSLGDPETLLVITFLGSLQPCLVWQGCPKALRNEKLPGHHKDFAAPQLPH